VGLRQRVRRRMRLGGGRTYVRAVSLKMGRGNLYPGKLEPVTERSCQRTHEDKAMHI
jgi:hypothetical protein